MELVKIANKTAIWLDHAQLINLSYKNCCRNVNRCYAMRKELFYFDAVPKCVNQKVEYANKESHENTGVLKKRKRKKQPGQLLGQTQIFLPDFETNVAAFLQQLKTNGTFKCAQYKTPTMPRYWDEQHEFPKFHGANSLNEFQRFSFGGQTYLIPAYSRFYSHNVTQLKDILGGMQLFDLIVMDPPWRNKYIRRLKRVKLELAYHMLHNSELQQLPIQKLIHHKTLVAIWCTNAQQHQRAVINDFLPAWDLRLVHTIKWLKVSTSGEPISDVRELGKKQPYEMLYIACHKDDIRDFSGLRAVEFIASIPSIVHSHKPPLLQWLQEHLPTEAKCLELFARYLQPQFTSIGLEVLKLMDERMYEMVEN